MRRSGQSLWQDERAVKDDVVNLPVWLSDAEIDGSAIVHPKQFLG